ncbi:unnamed protein product [Trichobilharzia szidati]|nr:unnamed protein product [Trichobilharzia szidati]
MMVDLTSECRNKHMNHHTDINPSGNAEIVTNISDDLPSHPTSLSLSSQHQVPRQELHGSYSTKNLQNQVYPLASVFHNPLNHIRDYKYTKPEVIKQISCTNKIKNNKPTELCNNSVDKCTLDILNQHCHHPQPISFCSNFSKSQLNSQRKRIYTFGTIKSKTSIQQHSSKRMKRSNAASHVDLRLKLFKNQLPDPNSSNFNNKKNTPKKMAPRKQTESLYSDEYPSNQKGSKPGDSLQRKMKADKINSAIFHEIDASFRVNNSTSYKKTTTDNGETSSNDHRDDFKNLLKKTYDDGQASSSSAKQTLVMSPDDYNRLFYKYSNNNNNQGLIHENIKRQLQKLSTSIGDASQFSVYSSSECHNNNNNDKPLDLRNPLQLPCNDVVLSLRNNSNSENENVDTTRNSLMKSTNFNEFWSSLFIWMNRKQNEQREKIQVPQPSSSLSASILSTDQMNFMTPNNNTNTPYSNYHQIPNPQTDFSHLFYSHMSYPPTSVIPPPPAPPPPAPSSVSDPASPVFPSPPSTTANPGNIFMPSGYSMNHHHQYNHHHHHHPTASVVYPVAAAAAAMAVATAVAAASFQPVSSSSASSSSCDQLYSTISSSNGGGAGEFSSQCTRNILQQQQHNNDIDLNQGESVSPSPYTNSNLPGSHLSVSGYPDIITPRAYPLTTSSTHIMDHCQTSSYDSDDKLGNQSISERILDHHLSKMINKATAAAAEEEEEEVEVEVDHQQQQHQHHRHHHHHQQQQQMLLHQTSKKKYLDSIEFLSPHILPPSESLVGRLSLDSRHQFAQRFSCSSSSSAVSSATTSLLDSYAADPNLHHIDNREMNEHHQHEHQQLSNDEFIQFHKTFQLGRSCESSNNNNSNNNE